MDSSNHVDVAYWRKHSDLNGYFTSLYCQKTPEEFQAREFNLERLILTEEDILELIEKVKKEIAEPGSGFEKASGFFWGHSEREDWIETLDILETVIDTTDFENEIIYYYCWY